MKFLILVIGLFGANCALANPTLNCENKDGKVRLVPTKPCSNCRNDAPAFKFIGGEGNLAGGIPEYDESMPGYIDYDAKSSAQLKSDVIGLIDGGTWTITMIFPKGFLSTDHPKGTTVKATMDSTYDDISQDELSDIELNCIVE